MAKEDYTEQRKKTKQMIKNSDSVSPIGQFFIISVNIENIYYLQMHPLSDSCRRRTVIPGHPQLNYKQLLTFLNYCVIPLRVPKYMSHLREVTDYSD
jgi:hypothetical protein